MVALTGRLGLPSSRFGRIVPGAVFLSSGPGTFDFNVHQISSKRVRVYYNDELTDTALNPVNYILTLTVPTVPPAPPIAIIPTINSVDFYDADHWSVVLNLAQPLTTGTSYSLGTAGVLSILGEEIISGAKNFDANVIDPPMVIGAWQSERGCVDILFDRSVGPTTESAIVPATFTIRDASIPGPGVAMALLPWAAEGIPETTFRVQLPGGMPAANSFVIDFIGVTDWSLNTATGTVPLTLASRAPLPYSYTSLTQLEIIDAYVSDVSNDYFNTGVVRVYFNGPVLDADTQINWAAYQSGVHIVADTANEVTSPIFSWSILSVLITIVNEFKADFNAHISSDLVHANMDTVNRITMADATNATTAYNLVNEVQRKYINHLHQAGVHLYDDSINTMTFRDVFGSYTDPILVIACGVFAGYTPNPPNIGLKLAYNNHVLLTEYPLSFSSAYGSPINQIAVFASYGAPNMAFETRGPYTLFADLRFIMRSNIPSVRLEATVTSEDGFSITSPANYTGSITARSRGIGTARVQSILVEPEISASILFDREIVLPGSIQAEVDDEPIATRSHIITSLPVSMWALNNIVKAYDFHLSWPPLMHRYVDGSDFASSGEYAHHTDLPSIIIAANSFKFKLNRHMLNSSEHWQCADSDIVQAVDATDIGSLSNLVSDMRRVCSDHIARIGPHGVRGFRVISAPINDTIVVDVDSMINGEIYTISGTLQDTYHDNLFGDPPPFSNYGYAGTDFFHGFNFTSSFIGLAIRPSVASAIPRIGLIGNVDGMRFGSDAVEVFFSKEMCKLPLSLSNLTISGGGILQKEADWIGGDRASVRVINMGPVSYTVVAINLTDEAGNPIY